LFVSYIYAILQDIPSICHC